MALKFMNLAQAKLKVKNPIVDLDGDEMARIIWSMIKQKLIKPYLDLDIKYFDLSIQSRDATNDEITIEAAKAVELHKVGVKCATITPDLARQQEFNLKQLWKSPNGTIRNYLQGTVIREPIIISNIPALIPGWKKPIIIARHAHADQYKATDVLITQNGKLELKFTPDDGSTPKSWNIHHFSSPGVGLAMFNTHDSIRNFAQSCFSYALTRQVNLFMTTKSTVLKTYDKAFTDVFEETFESFKKRFEELKLSYEHRLIDDMVAQVVKGEGGFMWACKNYDGDVMSDLVAQGFGSLGLMTSVLTTPSGVFKSEAAHGTVTRHYRVHQKGGETSTNSIASIFAWTRALEQRGKLDGNPDLVLFAQKIEECVIQAVENGKMTKDLALIVHGNKVAREHYLSTEEFIDEVASRFKRLIT